MSHLSCSESEDSSVSTVSTASTVLSGDLCEFSSGASTSATSTPSSPSPSPSPAFLPFPALPTFAYATPLHSVSFTVLPEDDGTVVFPAPSQASSTVASSPDVSHSSTLHDSDSTLYEESSSTSSDSDIEALQSKDSIENTIANEQGRQSPKATRNVPLSPCIAGRSRRWHERSSSARASTRSPLAKRRITSKLDEKRKELEEKDIYDAHDADDEEDKDDDAVPSRVYQWRPADDEDDIVIFAVPASPSPISLEATSLTSTPSSTAVDAEPRAPSPASASSSLDHSTPEDISSDTADSASDSTSDSASDSASDNVNIEATSSIKIHFEFKASYEYESSGASGRRKAKCDTELERAIKECPFYGEVQVPQHAEALMTTEAAAAEEGGHVPMVARARDGPHPDACAEAPHDMDNAADSIDGDGDEDTDSIAKRAGAMCKFLNVFTRKDGPQTKNVAKWREFYAGHYSFDYNDPELEVLQGRSRSASGSSTVSRSGRGSRATQLTTKQLVPDAKYLSYHEVTLTNEDIRALRNDWLTDNNISFWQTYLEHEVLPRYPEARIHLLRPSLSVLLAFLSTKDARESLPRFRELGTTHIFVPVNNARNALAEAGTHWSLLLVSVVDGVAFHYDSLGDNNVPNARVVTARLATLLGVNLRFRNIEDTPRQANNNDCGVFVCILMRFLLVKRLLNAHAREKVSMSLNGKMIDADGGRKEMLKTIENLRREAERRRSTSPFVRRDVPRIE